MLLSMKRRRPGHAQQQPVCGMVLQCCFIFMNMVIALSGSLELLQTETASLNGLTFGGQNPCRSRTGSDHVNHSVIQFVPFRFLQSLVLYPVKLGPASVCGGGENSDERTCVCV